MAILVSILGVIGVVIGVICLIKPTLLFGVLNYWDGPTRFRLAIIIRLVAAVLFLAIAPYCRMPNVIRALAAIALIAAGAIYFIGQDRLDNFINWWLARPQFVRYAGVFAVGFGALLIAAGA